MTEENEAKVRIWHYTDFKRPEHAIYVGRPTKWGNPYTVDEYGRGNAVRMFGITTATLDEVVEQAKLELVGKDLVCWCAPKGGMDYDQEPIICHAQILAKIANEDIDCYVDHENSCCMTHDIHVQPHNGGGCPLR